MEAKKAILENFEREGLGNQKKIELLQAEIVELKAKSRGLSLGMPTFNLNTLVKSDCSELFNP